MNSKERRRAQRERNRQYGEEFKVLQVRARLAGVPTVFIPDSLSKATLIYKMRHLVDVYEKAAHEGREPPYTSQWVTSGTSTGRSFSTSPPVAWHSLPRAKR